MESKLKTKLTAEMARGGQAYIRNLVAAEQAILQGQFNVAKLLRAMAHSQRAMAMEAARLLEEKPDAQALLNVILEEIGVDNDLDAPGREDPATHTRLEQSAHVRAGLRELVQRSLASLESNADISESDLAQFLRGCYGCGAILEGDPPHACPVCGALSVEFEGFGPFYSATAEHLGQLKPEEIIEILEGIPAEVEAVINNVDIAVLHQKPSPNEWCVAEIVGHMLETDLLFATRTQTLLTAQGTELPWPMPPWKLQEGKGYEAMQSAELLAHLRAARKQSLDLVRALTPADWLRKGMSFGSKISMLDMATWLANHDRGHLAQIKRLCTS
jgi:rubrerythrin